MSKVIPCPERTGDCQALLGMTHPELISGCVGHFFALFESSDMSYVIDFSYKILVFPQLITGLCPGVIVSRGVMRGK